MKFIFDTFHTIKLFQISIITKLGYIFKCPVLGQCPVSPLVHLLILGRFVKFVCYVREYDIDFQSGWSEDQRSGGKASGAAACGIAVFAWVVRLQGEVS